MALVADQERMERGGCSITAGWRSTGHLRYESRGWCAPASFTQVRRPIFTTSLGRWRPFAHRLQPLFHGMGEGPPGEPPALGI